MAGDGDEEEDMDDQDDDDHDDDHDDGVTGMIMTRMMGRP